VTALAASSTEPRPRPTRLRRVSPLLAVAGGVLLLSVALHLRDPHQAGSWGFCPWLVLTGTHCPGCGGLRAVNDLTRGDVAAAASSNLLLVASLPLALGWWSRSLAARWRGVAPARLPGWLVAPGAALAVLAVVAFWVLRNLPVGAALAP
jgi:hypothetical protein